MLGPEQLEQVLRFVPPEGIEPVPAGTTGLLAALLAAGDARLDRAAAARPSVGFVAAAVLSVPAWGAPGAVSCDWIPVTRAGTVPGRPSTTLLDPSGPWVGARDDAAALGVDPTRLGEVLADAPGRCLLVRTAWTGSQGWPGLWARAHRASRGLAATA